ncbi:hypothetical protein AXK56_05510 [Tsukamurella pulmonis]|uniref:Immunity protein Imm1 n=1 Tax=Tsukamurella pulmonis TaxID=47312 RepID=A0A1H1D553_9ACTN|nr:hypothetical protein [Tsukamurella pulmonis]KXO89634.1 hypothetical protein AXK56_05510 [Tsukamurella pulmonis]SDQ70956.1 hypothetical protein SAMN04489765_1521 [Tsukamurella pulmonis]SUP22557.1 Uncharacterised protein [Tsukamurella pulmonis]
MTTDNVPEDYFDFATACVDYSREHRRTTRHHVDLIEKYGTPRTAAEQALLGCLRALRDGRITEEWCVGVIDAGTRGELFYLVYRWRDHPITLGFAAEATLSPLYGSSDDPVTVGRDSAAFCIGEPLGSVADHLSPDGNDVHWWGTPLSD